MIFRVVRAGLAAALLVGLVSASAPISSAPLSASPAARQTVKFATLVPSGSVWDKAFRKLGSDWKKETDGRVQLRIYPDGSAGDEPAVIRKMKIGQLHAAALTASGLATIDPAFRVFEVPLFFRSPEEASYVLEKLTPTLKKRMEEKGFVLLHWGHVGWIHLFSTKPVRTPDDLRKLKQFVWGSRQHSESAWTKNGFNPVPLSVTDIPLGLETGLIEAFPAPPLSALSFQWFRSAPHMMSAGASPMLGASIMTTRAWKKLSDADKQTVLDASATAEKTLAREIPKQEQSAIAEMKKRGLTVVETGDAVKTWYKLGDVLAEQMTTDVPPEIMKQVERLRSEFRAGSAAK